MIDSRRSVRGCAALLTYYCRIGLYRHDPRAILYHSITTRNSNQTTMDLFLPRVYRGLSESSRTTTGMRCLSTRAAGASRPTPQLPNVRPFNHQTQLCQKKSPVQTQFRSFTASNHRPTKAILNPRKDENGEDMIIEIMPRASNVNNLWI